jgi:hypothetical protein
MEPRERKFRKYITIEPGTRYWTITQSDRVVYDTRTDVPCDMEKFEKQRREFEWRWSGGLTRHVVAATPAPVPLAPPPTPGGPFEPA